MVEIILDSGTTWTVPNDWDSDNNSVECFGGGSSGGAGASGKQLLTGCGGGAGAYARGDNIPLTRGETIQVRIGAGGASTSSNGLAGGDTCFNATDLADAVSKGDSEAVAAQGGAAGASRGNTPGSLGGLATSSVGNHTLTSGEQGGNGTASGGTSGAGGDCPNGGTGGAGVDVNSGLPGNPGDPPGGGGAGGARTQDGGAGANGRIRIRYEPLVRRGNMFLVFSNVAATLLSGWSALIGAVASLVAKRPLAGHKTAA